MCLNHYWDKKREETGPKHLNTSLYYQVNLSVNLPGKTRFARGKNIQM